MTTDVSEPSTHSTETARRKYALAVVLNDITDERERQEKKFSNGQTCANPDMHEGMKLAVLMEEVGEVANAAIERLDTARLREELIQVAAVAGAWAESLTPLPSKSESEYPHRKTIWHD